MKRMRAETRLVLGPKRRKAVAILIFLQAILFGLTTPNR